MTEIEKVIEQGSGQLTIDEIMQLYDRLGIPHFQRGLVWGNDAISSLLESLYFNTPCGSFVLWKPLNPKTFGKRLSNNSSPMDFLILDGQQRIRSLASIFRGLNEGDPEVNDNDEENEDDGKHIWCVNISSIPELQQYFDEPKKDRPLFRYLRNIWGKNSTAENEQDRRESISYKNNHIPLELFLKDTLSVIDWNDLKTKENNKYKKIILAYVNNQLKEKIKGLHNEYFFVVIKKESAAENKMVDMIKLYNRINSGGKKVESEEKCYATLLSLFPGTSDKVDMIFREIHDRENEANKEVNRDDVLSRRKERNFGFKLFIRVFIQVCNYHFGYSSGSSSLSFDIVNSKTFQKHFSDQKDHKKIEQLWDVTAEIIIYVHMLITKDLYCDSLQFLPETNSLTPIFQCLIQFPELMRKQEKGTVLQSLCLRLLLAELSPRDVLKLVAELRDNKHTAEQCLNIITKRIHSIDLRKDLKQRMSSSNTLADRFTLLLYWLERKNRAKDLSYLNIKNDKRRNTLIGKIQNEVIQYYGSLANYNHRYKTEIDISRDMPFIDESVSPEKQHLVPYSTLKEIYGIEDKSRLSTHESNNIGNITYISHYLNSFEYGVGQAAIDLDKEDKQQEIAHCFSDANGDSSKLRSKFKSVKNESTFKKFYSLRIEYIVNGFIEWIETLDRTAGMIGRLEAELPLFVEHKYFQVSQRIRLFNYDDRIEDILINLQTAMKLKIEKDNEPEISLCLNDKTSKKIKISLFSNEINVHVYPEKLSEPEKNKLFAVEPVTNIVIPYKFTDIKVPQEETIEKLHFISTVFCG